MLTYGQARGRWVLVATVLGSQPGVHRVAPSSTLRCRFGRELHAGLERLTWVVNAHALALAALMLLGGTLAGRFGRRRIFVLGVM